MASTQVDYVATEAFLRDQGRALSIDEEHALGAQINRLLELTNAIAARPVETEWHFAMITAVVVADSSCRIDRPAFDVAQFIGSSGDVTRSFKLAACRRAAALLPEVPFVFPDA